jgi:hypothetical protein
MVKDIRNKDKGEKYILFFSGSTPLFFPTIEIEPQKNKCFK